MIPAWSEDRYPDGYFNPRAGWAESGRVVERLLHEARGLGARILEDAAVARLIESGGRVRGAADGNRRRPSRGRDDPGHGRVDAGAPATPRRRDVDHGAAGHSC